MPTLNKYARSNEKTGYFIRANVGGSHPVTLQVTSTAEQIFKDNGYSDESNIPTKLVWSMYDVDLLYTESSVSSETPSYSFESLSDAVTGSQLTEGTRQDLVRYFEDYSGAHQKRVNDVLSELRREVTAGSIELYNSSEPVQNARNLLIKYSSKSGDKIDQFLSNVGKKGRQSLLTFGQRASQITDIDLTDQGLVSYQVTPLSVRGEVTVFDLTSSDRARENEEYDYRIDYEREQRTASIHIRDGTIEKMTGASDNLTSSEARQLANELTPVKINKSNIKSTIDAPSISELDIPERAFIQGDSDLLVGVVDRISNSDNPLVETDDGHLLLDTGDKDEVYLIDQIESVWGRVLCKLTRSDGTSTLADTMPLLGDEEFRDVDIEKDVVDAAASYHETHHEITEARVSEDRLEYATRAVMPDGSLGPVCGFSVCSSADNQTIVEVIAHPDDAKEVVEYGEPGIRHQVELADDVTAWETAVSTEFDNLRSQSRDALLTHQVEILQLIDKTLDKHTGCEPDSLISDVVSSGDLEDQLTHLENVWEESTILGELLAVSDHESEGNDGEKHIGTVDFFNDTGGYGFIETDACEDDVFYHMEDVGGPDITEGDELRFNYTQAEEGPRATEIDRVS